MLQKLAVRIPLLGKCRHCLLVMTGRGGDIAPVPLQARQLFDHSSPIEAHVASLASEQAQQKLFRIAAFGLERQNARLAPGTIPRPPNSLSPTLVVCPF